MHFIFRHLDLEGKFNLGLASVAGVHFASKYLLPANLANPKSSGIRESRTMPMHQFVLAAPRCNTAKEYIAYMCVVCTFTHSMRIHIRIDVNTAICICIHIYICMYVGIHTYVRQFVLSNIRVTTPVGYKDVF